MIARLNCFWILNIFPVIISKLKRVSAFQPIGLCIICIPLITWDIGFFRLVYVKRSFVCWLKNVRVFCYLEATLWWSCRTTGHRFCVLSVKTSLKNPSLFDCKTSNKLLEVLATFECYHWFSSKYSLCRIFQFLSTILDILGSVLLYVIINSGILFMLFFLLFVNSSFLSILPAFLVCSFRTSLYCLSRNFCLMKAQSFHIL